MGSIVADSSPLAFNVTVAKDLGPVPEPGTAEFLKLGHTDHIVTVQWTLKGSWEIPCLQPYANLHIPPTSSCLHYATECFEGMKCYRGFNGKLRLFRPDCNGERLAISAERASLPSYPPEKLKYLVAKLLEADGERWLPKHLPGNYLYIRPAVVGLGDKLGYQIPDQAMLFVVATPYRDLSRSPEGKPLSLKLQCSSPDSVRAWPGGFGYAKLGANYGPSLQAHRAALGNGFDQILWLFGEEKLVTEAGANNLFLVWKNKDTARNELVTPCLQNKMILSGITRRSVIELAKSKFTQSVGNLDPVDVIERDISIKDIDNVAREGRLVDAFVAGTAYFLMPVSHIRSGQHDIIVPTQEPNNGYVGCIKSWLEGIMYGTEENEWTYPIQG